MIAWNAHRFLPPYSWAEGSFMRTRSVLAAGFLTLFCASAAHAQYRGWQYSYGSGFQPSYGLGVHPAGRPSYQYGGPSPFLWYSPHEGYSYDYQNGLPWRRNTSTGPIGRGGASGVVRYSRPPQEPNESFFVRNRPADANAQAQAKNVEPAVAEQKNKEATAPSSLPAGATLSSLAPTRRATAVKSPARASYSAAAIRANGGGDWVPNVPSR